MTSDSQIMDMVAYEIILINYRGSKTRQVTAPVRQIIVIKFHKQIETYGNVS